MQLVRYQCHGSLSPGPKYQLAKAGLESVGREAERKELNG